MELIVYFSHRWGYRGVIIGWDETARAPAHWLEAGSIFYKNKEMIIKLDNFKIFISKYWLLGAGDAPGPPDLAAAAKLRRAGGHKGGIVCWRT